MLKDELLKAVYACKAETKEVIETILNEHNTGQRKKLLKKENIRTICVRFGVEIEEEE